MLLKPYCKSIVNKCLLRQDLGQKGFSIDELSILFRRMEILNRRMCFDIPLIGYLKGSVLYYCLTLNR